MTECIIGQRFTNSEISQVKVRKYVFYDTFSTMMQLFIYLKKNNN